MTSETPRWIYLYNIWSVVFFVIVLLLSNICEAVGPFQSTLVYSVYFGDVFLGL